MEMAEVAMLIVETRGRLWLTVKNQAIAGQQSHLQAKGYTTGATNF